MPLHCLAILLLTCLVSPLLLFGQSQPSKFKKPTATPAELIRAKKDFKVELLYSVPRETQGSWVSMCVDPKGRLITSDQYGRLYRVTPPPIGGKAEQTKVEKLPVDLGEAQGLVWAFDSLYVVVNRGKKIPRAACGGCVPPRTTTCSTARNCCGPSTAAANTGRMRVLLGTRRQIALRRARQPHQIDRTWPVPTVPQDLGRGFPRAAPLGRHRGHAVGIMAPAGCIYKTDKDGKNWTLVSMGYRNQYDAAFNRDGELFTYDADMEWDMNTALVSADARLPCRARQRVRLARRHRQDVRIPSRQSAAGRQCRARQPHRHLLRLRGQISRQISRSSLSVRLELTASFTLAI